MAVLRQGDEMICRQNDLALWMIKRRLAKHAKRQPCLPFAPVNCQTDQLSVRSTRPNPHDPIHTIQW